MTGMAFHELIFLFITGTILTTSAAMKYPIGKYVCKLKFGLLFE